MAIPEHGGGFLAGYFDGVRRNGRAKDVVQPSNPLDLLLRRSVGQDDGVVLILPGKRLPLWMKRGHDFAWKVCDSYHFANRIFDAKELVTHRTSENTNVGGPIHIVLRKCRALVDKPALNVEIFRRNAAIGRVPVLVAIDDLYRVVYVRRDGFDQ